MSCSVLSILKCAPFTDFTLQYIQENGFQRPLVFKDAAALGLK